jgi:mannitol-specific phosphotransferase system IIBC component
MFHEDDGVITPLGQVVATRVGNTIKLFIESENPTPTELIDLAWILTNEVQSVIADKRIRLRLNAGGDY